MEDEMANIEPTKLNGKTLYKVLVGGKSCHGGDFTWSLPRETEPGVWEPGEWHEVAGAPELCTHGFHLTTEPAKWGKVGLEVYEVEADGIGEASESSAKVVVKRVRLLRRIADVSALAALCILTSGQHSVETGNWFASGSATVEASGSATVRASDSATVRAYDSATVRAYDSATVDAYDSATVRASGSATVRAYDSATVEAYDSATVEAYDSATVRAYNNATVEAYDSATVRASDSATVRDYDSATESEYNIARVRG